MEPQEGARTLLENAYLVPGLTDMHAHLSLNAPSPSTNAAERVRASLDAHLRAGVLAVREPGSPDRESAGRGPHEGLPRTFTAGRFLAPPGRYFPGLARDAPGDRLAELGEEELRASGEWVKIIGDDPTGGDGPVRTYSRDQLESVAARVHMLGGRIAIHVSRGDVIEDAIDAGFDSIEHGIGIRDEHLRAMATRGTAFVPTLLILEAVEAIGHDAGAAGRDLVAGVRRHPDMVRRAHELGVRVLAGTDAGMGPHGMVRREIARLLDAGLPADTALGAGSWEGRRYLGLAGIEEGAPADLVAFIDDPADPEVLARPVLIVLEGRLYASEWSQSTITPTSTDAPGEDESSADNL